MRRGAVWLLAVAGLSATLAFMIWAFLRVDAMGGEGLRSWTGGSPHILAAMLIGVLGSGALAAALIALAFFSARRGYDDRAGEATDGEDG